jgi:hypothetical protein
MDRGLMPAEDIAARVMEHESSCARSVHATASEIARSLGTAGRSVTAIVVTTSPNEFAETVARLPVSHELGDELQLVADEWCVAEVTDLVDDRQTVLSRRKTRATRGYPQAARASKSSRSCGWSARRISCLCRASPFERSKP